MVRDGLTIDISVYKDARNVHDAYICAQDESSFHLNYLQTVRHVKNLVTLSMQVAPAFLVKRILMLPFTREITREIYVHYLHVAYVKWWKPSPS